MSTTTESTNLLSHSEIILKNGNLNKSATLNPYFSKSHSKISKGCGVDVWKQRNLNSHLLEAIYKNESDKVKSLLNCNAEPNSTCRTYKFTALHLAVLTASESIIITLIEKGAKIDAVDKKGLTPLHYAAWHNRSSCIDILLEHIDDSKKNNCINLMAEDSCPIVKEYVKDSIDHTCGNYESEFPMIIKPGATALHIACQFIHQKCVETLLKYQPDVNLKDDRGLTPFEVIGENLDEVEDNTEQNFIKIIRMMQNNIPTLQTSYRVKYFTPLHAAVILCSEDAINILRKEYEFPLNILDHYGQTPIHLAIIKQLEKPLISLLVCVDDISIYKNAKGLTPFQIAVECQWIQGVGLLLDANANVAEVAADGRTVLHVASSSGNDELLEELLELEETEKILNAQNNLGETPIFCAVSSGNLKCVTALIEKNALIDTKLNGNINILHRAAEYGNEDILTALLKVEDEYKLNLIDDLDTFEYSGMAPIHLAAMNNKVECVKELLYWSCDYEIKVRSPAFDGEMAIHLAASRGNKEVVGIILEHDMEQLCVKNSKRQTPLHCAALHGQRNCIELLLNAGADLNCCFEDETALDIIYRSISRPTEFLETIFDNAIKIDDKDTLITDKNCMIDINFNILIPQHDSTNQMKILSNILFNGKNLEQKKLLLHPLIESFLYLKWNRMSKIFWFLLSLYAIFVICLTFFVITLFYYNNENRPAFLNNIEIMRFSLITALLSVLIPEILLIHQKLKQYTINTDRIIKWSSIILVTILIFVHDSENQSEWLRHLATIALLTSWIEMMFMLSKIPTWGYYVQMFFKVSQNVIKVMTVFSFLVIGFALAFMIEFQTTEPFTDPLGGLIKTIVMMTAELDYSGLFTGENAENAKVINLTLYVLFLMMGTIVLMNLLVGLAVSDIHDLEIIGKVDRHAQQIVFLSMLESDTLSKFLPEKFKIKLIKDKCVHSELKMYPSNPKCSVIKLLPTQLKENIIDIAVDNVRRKSDISNVQLSKQIDELKHIIEDLRNFIFSNIKH